MTHHTTEPGFSPEERQLGMDTPIPRRDLLQGGLVWAGTQLIRGSAPLVSALAAMPALAESPNAAETSDYPPSLTGMRGSNDAAYASAHALRDGQTWSDVKDLDETYDLIVVGGGISGLAAAHFYQAAKGPQARILILDNHDDFGGHARRNEFHLNGQMHLLNGGTLEIDSPRPYSRVADGLLRELGVNVPALQKQYPSLDMFEGLAQKRGVFLDQETFGRDVLLTGSGGRNWAHHTQDSPLAPEARQDLIRLLEGNKDYLAGQSIAEKMDALSRMSYEAYLRDTMGLHPQVITLWSSRSKGWWAVGIDAISALDAWGMGFEGFNGLKLPAQKTIARMGPSPAGYNATGGSYRLHFPDGNATIARLLVRRLIPQVAPPASAAQTVTQRFDYSQLDLPSAPVRLRLRSTVVRALQNKADGTHPVSVTYVSDSKAYRVRARHTVLACYNGIIPYLCPELPEAQKTALHSLVKAPLVYTSVALRSAQPFLKAGVSMIEAPGCYHTGLFLNPAIRIGNYHTQVKADQPLLVHMQRTPCQAGLPEKEQNRAGRRELLSTPYETFELKIREQLARMLGPYGFNPATDIMGITVNRWAHGYAPEYNPLSDPDLPPSQRAHVLGRAPFGAITIANSDSGGLAYTDIAIDQAHRAVQELLS